LAGDILITDTVGAILITVMVILITDTVGATRIILIILIMDTDILTTDTDMVIIHTIPAEEVLLILTECIVAIITVTEVIRKTGLMLTEEQVILISIEMVRPQPLLALHSEEVIRNPSTTLLEQTAPEVKTTTLPDHTPQVTTLAEAIAEADHLAVVAVRLEAVAAEDHLAVVVEEDNHPIFV
jgi:hypothetical protein